MNTHLAGSIVALITPFNVDGSVDFVALKRLIDFHIAQGSKGLAVAATTGESPTISVEEHVALIRAAVEYANGRIAIIAGTGANSTDEAIALTHAAFQAGAVAGLSVTPYYNRPTQEGLFQHFKAIAEASPLPLILYNVPGRTACDMHNDTILRLAAIEGVIGLKDATGDLVRATDLIARAPANFALLSGDDATALAYQLLGGHGVITVTGNAAPRAMQTLCEAARQGDLATARRINQALFGLNTKLFVEANPIPVKWVMAKLGLCGGTLRLPLTPLSAQFESVITQAMQDAGEWLNQP